ncbi:hypothetical protein BTO30_11775 [Domibacillus antri]|uniref:DUF421 domain-containing protein n=1 Tax=Domibacillus antri TaxID=1714264 RepID=A0A1Q8Q3T2_9BACI|nr:DUF421 domain-containing protein [Domibacillus antri]OLN22004.1 hypothetical protein BTO30_11775 [Domibacillus antri]
MGIFEVIIRVLVSFLSLLCLTKLMERKEIAQMTFFNFSSAISIGSIAGNLVSNPHQSIRNGLISLVAWSLLTIIIGLIVIKSKKARKIINGEPLIVIQNGKIMKKPLQKASLDLDALNALLRQKNIFSITEVEYAIFETTGKLSVMKKESKLPVTKEDLKIAHAQKQLSPIMTEVVSDGIINMNNLVQLNLTKEWLNQQLQQAGVKAISDVFYAEVQQDGTLFIDYKKEHS